MKVFLKLTSLALSGAAAGVSAHTDLRGGVAGVEDVEYITKLLKKFKNQFADFSRQDRCDPDVIFAGYNSNQRRTFDRAAENGNLKEDFPQVWSDTKQARNRCKQDAGAYECKSLGYCFDEFEFDEDRAIVPDLDASDADSDASSAGIQNKLLTVTVMGASDLQGEDTVGTSDVYVKVKVYKDNWGADTTIGEYTTSIINDLNPVWNEAFEFLVPSTQNMVLKLTVMDKDPLSDDEIGEVRIKLDDHDLSAAPTVLTEVVDSHWTSEDEKITVSLTLQ